jgi:NitT/TauT family transport system permease protein
MSGQSKTGGLGISTAPDGDSPSLTNWSALAGARRQSLRDVALILLVAAVILGGAEILIRVLHVPRYVFPPPSVIATTLVRDFHFFWPHVLVTLEELAAGFTIGASVGFILAMIVTQFPLADKILTPYILLLVTTPMLALVPLLILKFGFGLTPRIIAVALASGPMVMINSATGFGRTEARRIALARSFGANTLQIFLYIRIPSAVPMVIVGMMVGAIFGLLTAVGAEMVGGQSGLGSRLTYYSSLIQMPQFFACIVILAIIGLLINLLFRLLGRIFASWEA